jgi:hypothetical protein
MTTQIDIIITYAAAAAVLTGWGLIAAYVGLRIWNGWLTLKHAEMELTSRHGAVSDPVPLSAGARIDLADLKERIRKLEAIASGVDL